MSRGRPTYFDTEAVAAEIARDGIWPVVVRHGMSYAHAMRIRNGWRPKEGLPTCLRGERGMSDTRADKLARMAAAVESPHEAATAAAKLAEMQTSACRVPDATYRPETDIPRGIQCGAETFDGMERRRCTRPASQVRDGLLVCKQHERVELVYWVGRGIRTGISLPARSVPQITARRRVPGGWHLFDHDGVAATGVEDLPVTPVFVRSRRPGDPAPSVREVFPK